MITNATRNEDRYRYKYNFQSAPHAQSIYREDPQTGKQSSVTFYTDLRYLDEIEFEADYRGQAPKTSESMYDRLQGQRRSPSYRYSPEEPMKLDSKSWTMIAGAFMLVLALCFTAFGLKKCVRFCKKFKCC